MARIELIEAASFITMPKMALVEDASRGGKLIVRGEFGRSGVPTANRRIYPRTLWAREFQRLAESIRNKTLTGALNHPKDGRADMFNTAHIITGLTLDPQGVVIGEAEVMEDTPGGKIVTAIYRRGGKVGVSSRGFGSTEVNEDGHDVVQEDYQLVTFDFVSDPADQFAYPEQVNEGSKFFSFPLGESAAMTEAKGGPEALLKATAEIRESAERGVYERLLKDPTSLPKPVQESLRAAFGGGEQGPKLLKANGLLQAELAEVRGKLKTSEEALAESLVRGREATYRYFVERCLAGDADADEIREGVGPVLQYESVPALRTKIEGVRADLLAQRQLQEEANRRAQQEIEAAAQERAAVTEELARTRAALEKSLQLNRELALEQYRTEATQVAPSPRAKAVLEAAPVQSFEEVDQLLESLRPRQQTPEGAAAARTRARTWLGSGTRTPSALDEERPTTPQGGGGGGEAIPGLGASWNELRALSGVGGPNN